MISIGAVASIDYYFEGAEKLGLGKRWVDMSSKERKQHLKTLANQGKVPPSGLSALIKSSSGSYYAPSEEKLSDPLARAVTVRGGGAGALGLKVGQEIDAGVFKNLYFGRTPDGSAPLHAKVAPINEQAPAMERVREWKAEAVSAKAALDAARTAAKKDGLERGAAEADQRVVDAAARLLEAQAGLKKAERDKSYRRAGTDVSLSPGQDYHLLHARFLADGKFEEAQELEDFFKHAAVLILDELAAKITSSGGESTDGTRGEQVEAIYALALHFDARPTLDANGLWTPAAHNMHIHTVFFNEGLRSDGTWGAIRTEELDAHRLSSDARLQSMLAQFMAVRHGAHIKPKMLDSGKILGWQAGASAVAEKSEHFGARSEQIAANKQNGLSGRAAKKAGRLAKAEDWNGADHIAYQKEVLDAAGLGLKAILGSEKADIAALRRTAEEELVRQYNNRVGPWTQFAEKGHKLSPGRKPEPFGGVEAREWMQKNSRFLEAVKRERAEGKDLPKSPGLTPPGHARHDKKKWREAVNDAAAAEHKRLWSVADARHDAIVGKMLAMESAFGEKELVEHCGRVTQFADLGLGRKASFDDICKATLNRQDELRRAVLAEADILSLESARGRAAKGEMTFTTREQREAELRLYGETVPRLLQKREQPALGRAEISDEIRAYEKSQGFPFSPQQRATIANICAGSTQLSVVQGWAGSGKSAMSGCIVKILQEKLGYEVIAMAPTNSASDLLRKEIGAAKSYTPQKLALEMDHGKVALGPKQIIFADEVSMLDFQSGNRLLTDVARSGARIIASGDVRQLESVGQGNVAKKLLSAARASDAETKAAGGKDRALSEINAVFSDFRTLQRQKTAKGKQLTALMETGEWSEALREMTAAGMIDATSVDATQACRKMCDIYGAETARFASAGVAWAVRGYEEALGRGLPAAEIERWRAEAERELSKTTEAYRKVVMIAETNRDVATLCEFARADLKAAGMLGTTEVTIEGVEGRKLQVALGERLVLRDKLTSKDVVAGKEVAFFKGVALTVVGIEAKGGRTRLECVVDDKEVRGGVKRFFLDPQDFNGLAYGYAMTTHLSQGGSWDTVLSLASKGTRSALTLVGMTRWQRSCRLFAVSSEFDKIRAAVGKTVERLDAMDRLVVGSGGLQDEPIDAVVQREAKTRRGESAEAIKAAGRGLDDSQRKAALSISAKAASALAAVPAAAEPAMEKAKETVEARLAAAAKAAGNARVASAFSLGIVPREGAARALTVEGSQEKTWLCTAGGKCYAYSEGRIEAWDARELSSAGGEHLVEAARHHVLSAALAAALDPAAVGEAAKPDEAARGEILEIGVSPFKDTAGAKPTPWARIRAEDGEISKVWGVDLHRALEAAGAVVGTTVSLDNSGRTGVEVPCPADDPAAKGTRSVLVEDEPRDGGPAVVREVGADGKKKGGKGLTVFGNAAAELAGKKGMTVELAFKSVERAVWEARLVAPANLIPSAKREEAWKAAEALLADPEALAEFSRVGVGASSMSIDTDSPEKIARRTWVANGDGVDAVVMWNQTIGAGDGASPAWHRAGELDKGEDGIARSRIDLKVVFDDGEKIYCAAAVGKVGSPEAAASYILGFDKAELGLQGRLRRGADLAVSLADGYKKPLLVSSGAELESAAARASIPKSPDFAKSMPEILEVARGAGSRPAAPPAEDEAPRPGSWKPFSMATALDWLAPLREAKARLAALAVSADAGTGTAGSATADAVGETTVLEAPREAADAGSILAESKAADAGGETRKPIRDAEGPADAGTDAKTPALPAEPGKAAADAGAKPMPAPSDPRAEADAAARAKELPRISPTLADRAALAAKRPRQPLESTHAVERENWKVLRGVLLTRGKDDGTVEIATAPQAKTPGGIDWETTVEVVSVPRSALDETPKVGRTVTIGISSDGACHQTARPEAVKAVYTAKTAEGLSAATARNPAALVEPDDLGMTAAHHAASRPGQPGRDAVTALAMAGGLLVMAKDALGRTPLDVASDPAHVEAEARRHLGATLRAAADRGDTETMFWALGEEDILEERDSEGRSALHHAVRAGNIEAMDLLLQAGADLEAADGGGRTPLHLAASSDTGPALGRLLEAGAKPEASDAVGTVPLHLAADRGDAASIRLLLAKQADPNAKGTGGFRPLHLAAQGGHDEAVAALLRGFASAKAKTDTGRTPADLADGLLGQSIREHGDRRAEADAALMKAVKAGDAEGAAEALKHANPNGRGTEDRATLLTMAAGKGDHGVVKALLDAGADTDVPALNGETALHRAIRADDRVSISLLLKAGAKDDIRSKEGKTAAGLFKADADLERFVELTRERIEEDRAWREAGCPKSGKVEAKAAGVAKGSK